MTVESPRVLRIVVTDDDPSLMAFLVDTLRDAGHCVFAAFDGDSACELALLVPDMDLMVTNTRIGEVSGGELIRLVRREKPGLPILHVGEPLPNPDGRLNDVHTIQEPFTADQLLASVRSVIARQNA
jgi:DNA-binding response OmpR family regulator